jgi:hypothetical protein
MADKKYQKYVIKAPMGKSKRHAHLPLHVRFRDELSPWKDLNMGLVVHLIREPLLMLTETHKHLDFNQVLFFLSGDPRNPEEFDAEVEFCMGEEKEKYIITEPTVIRVPPGTYHGPLFFKRIGKPIMFIDTFQAPEYKKVMLPGDEGKV